MIALSAGPLRALIAPEIGGSLLGLWRETPIGTLPLLRSIDGERAEGIGPTDCAMFPMAPFANRLRGNRLVAGRRSFGLAPNVSGQDLCLHGDAWLSSWETVRSTPHEASLAYRSRGSLGPYDYRAEQHFSLDERGLTVKLAVTNLGEPLPFSLGFHPYFPRHPATRLQFKARSAWVEGPDFLPAAKAAPGDLPWFDQPSTIPEGRLNNPYEGWDGRLAISQPEPEASMVMTASAALDTLMVFTREGADFIALEPQSHLSGALSDPEHPLGLLGGGNSVDCWIRMRLLDAKVASG